MFTSLFVATMLGHFVGDYVFQNQWMALGKSQPGWKGHLACTVHVLLYTLAIAMFTGLYTPAFLALVAMPHWLIDRFALAWYWIDFKNPIGHKKIWELGPVCAQPAPTQLEQNVWKVAFAAPVYIANDNTFHWVCLWLTLKLLIK